MKNQILNSEEIQTKNEMLTELENISRAKIIIKADEVIEFLLKVKQTFFPEHDRYSFDQLNLFKAEDGWYISTPDGNAVYADHEDGIQDLAHILLHQINEQQKDA